MPVLGPVALAFPEHRLPQQELRDVAAQVLPPGPSTDAILAVFDNADIRERHLARPVEWYLEPHGHKDRAAVYAEVGLNLVEDAARMALERARLKPDAVDAILLVSTTGIATPSLDARLLNRMSFRRDVVRLPIWGLGCAGGVAGLNRAAELARAGKTTLLVCMETCSLQFDIAKAMGIGGKADKKSVIAASLFSDGAAALVVSPSGHGPRHLAGAAHHFPGTERVMGWDVEDNALDVVLSPKIPEFVQANLGPIASNFMAQHGTPDHYALHPGGAKVIDALRDALKLDERQLAATREVLRAHGNMSSPTVLAVLERVLQGKPAPGALILLSSLGPGFAAELAMVQT